MKTNRDTSRNQRTWYNMNEMNTEEYKQWSSRRFETFGAVVAASVLPGLAQSHSGHLDRSNRKWLWDPLHCHPHLDHHFHLKEMTTEESMPDFECPLSFGYHPAPSQLIIWKDWVSKNDNAKENEKRRHLSLCGLTVGTLDSGISNPHRRWRYSS